MRVSEKELQRIAKKVGRRIQELRRAAGITQMELEQRGGVYDVGAIERGEKNPTLLTLLRVAKALKVELKDVLDTPEKQSEEKRIQMEVTGLLAEEDLATQRKALELLRLFLS